MKKYNKLTSLILFIAFVFTSFFIWSAQAASPNPKINIVTVEGNAEHLKPVELYGSISNNLAYGELPIFHFENNQVTYVDDKPLIQKFDGHSSTIINDLIANYRSFMRGKTRQTNQYIMTDEWVVYTAVATDVYWQESAEDELIISILNKNTKEENEHRIDLDDNMNYFNLQTAYLNYPELSIVLTKYNTDDEEEHFIYSFDLENPKEELVERINFSDKIKEDEFFYVGNSFDKTGRFIPFQTLRTVETTIEDDDDVYTDIQETTGYFVYDILERRFIDIPLFEENSTHLFTDQNQLYVAEDLGEVLSFYEMNPNTETLESIGQIDLALVSNDQMNLDSYNHLLDPNLTVYNGKLYAYEEQEFKNSYLPFFQVIDFEKNETLFLGRLDASEDSKMDAPNIYVHEYRLSPLVK